MMNLALDEQYVGEKLAPFNPINKDGLIVALNMLDVVTLIPDSVFYDLGCGDGRALVEACRMNGYISAVGIEYDLSLCGRAREIIMAEGYESRAQVVHGNVIGCKIDNASAIFIYLVPEGLKALKNDLLAALERNVRIVTYVFSIPGLKPARVEVYKSSTKLYLYTRESLVF